jgi:hypothetical protein
MPHVTQQKQTLLARQKPYLARQRHLDGLYRGRASNKALDGQQGT